MNVLLEKIMARPSAQKGIVMGLSITVLSVGAALSWLGATSPPQITAPPVVTQNTDWLVATTNDLEYSREQVRLFLLNQDPTRGQMGLLWGQINAEALRMLGTASISVQNPKDSCYAKTLVECLEAYEINIQKEYSKAIKPSDKATAIIRFLAAEIAIDSVISQRPIMASEPQNSLMQVLIEKVKIDRGAARVTSPDGVAAQFQKDKAEAERVRKAEEKAMKDFEGK